MANWASDLHAAGQDQSGVEVYWILVALRADLVALRRKRSVNFATRPLMRADGDPGVGTNPAGEAGRQAALTERNYKRLAGKHIGGWRPLWALSIIVGTVRTSAVMTMILLFKWAIAHGAVV